MFFIIPTPIGNLDDITKRAIDTISSLDLLFCENTQNTNNLLLKFGINGIKLKKYVDYNETKIIPEVISLLKIGQKIGIVSDAGYPTISDPGYKLIRAIKNEGLDYTVLPGASSILPTLIYSALPSNNFVFIGFLSKKRGKLKEELSKYSGITTIFFESPHRIIKTLKIILDNFPQSQITVCREISKLHEEVVSGDILSVYEKFESRLSVKGEISVAILINN